MINQSYLILDLETTSNEKHGRKGHYAYNDIIAIGLCNKEGVYTQYIYPERLTNLAIDEQIVIGHNIKYDLLYVWELPQLQEWISNGGTIWDTQFVENIITGQQTKYAALRDIAVNKYGCKERPKHIERLLFDRDETDTSLPEYKSMIELPKELVLEDVKNDVLDTEQVFLQQYKYCEENKLLPLIQRHMEALLMTTEAEYNGMKISDKVLIQNESELRAELQRINDELVALVKEFWR